MRSKKDEKSTAMNAETKEPSFEEAFKRLSEIVDILEVASPGMGE